MPDTPRQTFELDALRAAAPDSPGRVPEVIGTPVPPWNDDPLAAVLDERVRDAARALAFRAERVVFDPAKPGRACASVTELRDALDRLGDAAGFADLHAGGCIEDVAAELAMSMAAARRRFGDGTPPALPLSVVIADLKGPP